VAGAKASGGSLDRVAWAVAVGLSAAFAVAAAASERARRRFRAMPPPRG